MRIARLVVFDGPEDWLIGQMGRSLPVGVKLLPNGARILIAEIPLVGPVWTTSAQLAEELVRGEVEQN